MDTISVIVPVYNIQNYIKRCVESIVNQTFTKLQIILVDDGSTDESGKICDEMAASDTRIEVFHKSNGGLSDARNFGLERARGEYVAFVDGDDYIDSDMYESLYKEIVSTAADIASCGYYEVFDDKIYTKCCVKETIVLDKIRAYETLFSRGGLLGCSSCNKLFRKNIFDDIKYKVGIQSEDLELIYRILDKTQTVVCVDAVKYHYVHRENSITTSAFNKRSMDVIYTSEKMIQFVHLNYPEIIKQAYAYQVMWLIGGLKSIYETENRSEFSTEESYIKMLIRKNWKWYVRNSYIYWAEYILLWAALLNLYKPVQTLLSRCVMLYHRILKRRKSKL